MLDRFPVSALLDRYNIGKTVLYERIKALKIQPEKEGGRSFINPDQLATLDRLNEFIKAGGSTPDFVRSLADGQGEQPQRLVVAGVDTLNGQGEQPDWMALLLAIANFSAPRLPDPLSPQRQLEEIAAQGWVVTTSQLREVMGMEPREGDRLGFTFSKAGRQGRENGWTVKKAGFAPTSLVAEPSSVKLMQLQPSQS